jgi:hypothetical protein
MTHSALHLAVRHALRGSRYWRFAVVAESIERDPGGVVVEWRLSLYRDGGSPIVDHHFRNHDPYALLTRLREALDEEARTATADTLPPGATGGAA